MDENTLYKTAVVVAITEIPPMSIYHYTKTFGEFFSATAAQHKRGRRWAQADVNLLLSIQCLFHKREGREKIRQELASGWRIGNQPIDSQEAAEVIDKLIRVANQLQEQARETFYQAQAASNKLNQYTIRMEKDHTDLENMKKALVRQAQEINLLATKKHGIFG